MSSLAMERDIGAWIKTVPAIAQTVAVAAGGGDATEKDGITIDLLSYGTRYKSGKLAIFAEGTLQDAETCTFIGNFQDSADGQNWSDYGDALSATVTLTGPSGDGVDRGVAELDVDLSGARRYIRAQATPNLSASGTDTLVWNATLILGGAQEKPAS